MKTCSRCRQEKPQTGFYKRQRSRDGLAYECKGCKDAATRAYKAELVSNNGYARERALMVTDAGRLALQEREDAEARRVAMEHLFGPYKPYDWQKPRLEEAA